MKLKHSEPYAPLRAAAYPQPGDQLDALLKFVLAMQAQGVELPPETQAWVDQCQEVKQTYRKP